MKFQKKIIYKLQYWTAVFFIKLILLFPENLRFAFAEKVGELYFKLDKRRKAISIANLSLAFPNMTYAEKESTILKSYKVIFKAFFSTIWFDKYLNEEGKINIVNLEAIDKAMAEKNGAITACMHMGNMESSVKASWKYKAVTVAKKQRNPYIDDLVTKNRANLNVKLLKKSKTTSRDLKELMGKGYIIGLFSDHRDKGATVSFFGHETTAPTGAVSLAMRNNLPLFLIYNILNSDNTSTLYILDELKLVDTGNFKQDLQINVQNLIYEMEKVILKHPDQWMWFHDRWNLSKTFKKK